MRTPVIRRAALGLSFLAALAGPARGQSPDNPLLVLTISGGWITGGRMWLLPRQEETVAGGALDTVGLERRFRTGVVMGLGAALFRSPHFGYSAELVFLGTGTESRCFPPAQWSADGNHINEQACDDIQGQNVGTSIVALEFGGTWRPIATGPVRPYLRLVAGPGYLGGSYVETSGTVAETTVSGTTYYNRSFLDEPHHRTWTWVVTLGAGVTLRMSPDAQLRFEARDVVTNLPVVTGPSSPPPATTPTQVTGKTFHLVSFAAGLDILLEQSARRTRRY